MSDQTIELNTYSRNPLDIATELTKAMIEQRVILTVEDATGAFQEFFNAAFYAHENKKN